MATNPNTADATCRSIILHLNGSMGREGPTTNTAPNTTGSSAAASKHVDTIIWAKAPDNASNSRVRIRLSFGREAHSAQASAKRK